MLLSNSMWQAKNPFADFQQILEKSHFHEKNIFWVTLIFSKFKIQIFCTGTKNLELKEQKN
jgi:hypothetical protein